MRKGSNDMNYNKAKGLFVGSIAGALYGYKSIPKHLSEEILHIEELKQVFYKLVDLRWDIA